MVPAQTIVYELLIAADIEAVRKTNGTGDFSSGFSSGFDTFSYQYRIYRSIIEANVPYPYIVIVNTGYDDVTSHAGPTGMENHNYQVGVVGDDMAVAIELQNTIRDILDWYNDSDIQLIRYQSNNHFVDPDSGTIEVQSTYKVVV